MPFFLVRKKVGLKGQLHQFHAALGAGGLQVGEGGFDAALRCLFVQRKLTVRKQRVQLHDAQRLVGREQGGFDDAGDELLIHAVQSLESLAAPSSSNSLDNSSVAGASSPEARDFT